MSMARAGPPLATSTTSSSTWIGEPGGGIAGSVGRVGEKLAAEVR
jgi:hypothetical protein